MDILDTKYVDISLVKGDMVVSVEGEYSKKGVAVKCKNEIKVPVKEPLAKLIKKAAEEIKDVIPGAWDDAVIDALSKALLEKMVAAAPKK